MRRHKPGFKPECMCVTSDLQGPASASQLAGLQANTTATRGDFSSVLYMATAIDVLGENELGS